MPLDPGFRDWLFWEFHARVEEFGDMSLEERFALTHEAFRWIGSGQFTEAQADALEAALREVIVETASEYLLEVADVVKFFP
ncbi:MAG: hypothetical protein MI806_34190 [Minwuiales bacterium]|nr:hypothetical protein [Minwuiales bacterium]